MPGTRSIGSALKCSDPLFLEFLEGCLRWDTKKRFTPSQALKHPWIVDTPAPVTVQQDDGVGGNPENVSKAVPSLPGISSSNHRY